MLKYRILLRLDKGPRISNVMPLVDAAVMCAVYCRHGRSAELIPDTQSLALRLRPLDDQVAREMQGVAATIGAGAVQLVAWDGNDIPPPCCPCDKCQPKGEHPAFAPPELKHGQATEEPREEEPHAEARRRREEELGTIPMPQVRRQERRRGIAAALWGLVEWVIGVEPGL